MVKMKHLSTKRTQLAVASWIRTNYKGNNPYPLVLETLSAMYIKSVHERWDTSSIKSILASADLKIATRNWSYTDLYIAQIHGFIEASTLKGNHLWILRINKFEKQLTIGLDEINNNKHQKCHRFALYRYRDNGFNDGVSIYKKDVTTHCIDHVKNYDILLIRLHETIVGKNDKEQSKLEFCIVRDGNLMEFLGSQALVERTIPTGVYQLNAALHYPGDSITLLQYRQPKCFHKLKYCNCF